VAPPHADAMTAHMMAPMTKRSAFISFLPRAHQNTRLSFSFYAASRKLLPYIWALPSSTSTER
jgi:hypothetical protein